ncbi:MAG: hypothetical protein OJF55_001887 [Rhodanobacteraceae bacterium]|nr:MAG: hypothetical protein OJF55_001887 [Rhodanobacteraceae bacterium]
MLTAAPLESARFGLRVYRATLPDLDPDTLFEEMVAKRVDLAIIRKPVRTPSGFHPIETRGLYPIHADTLVSYECPLSEYEPRAVLNPNLRIEEAQPQDRAGILALIQTVFAEYPNHYRANPLLSANAIVAGYAEWALSHLDGADRIAWVARIDGQIAALACSAFDRRGRCQGVLHGVHPDFSGRGIYTDLIRHTQHYFRERGYRKLAIQTQVGNLPVQRVWAREGFTFSEVYDTFHINALLDIERAGQRSAILSRPACRNNKPLSQNDAAMSFLAKSIDVATESGACILDTTQANCSAAIWSPATAPGDYQVRVRAYPTPSGRQLVSATLHDAGGKVCGIARFDTTHKSDSDGSDPLP